MLRAELIADIPFDRPLAEVPSLKSGWCEPEEQFSWTVGHESRLVLPCPGIPAASYTLIIQGHPYLSLPDLSRQRLAVSVNGVELASLIVDGLFTELIRVPKGIVTGAGAEIVFGHPDSESPARHGSTDTRRLGMRFWRIRFFRLSKAKRQPQEIPDHGDRRRVAVAQQLTTLARQAPLTNGELSLSERLVTGTGPIQDAALNLVFRKLFLECLTHGYTIAASEMTRRAVSYDQVTLEFDGSVGTDLSIVRFTKTVSGACILGLSPVLRGMSASDPDMSGPMVMWHLLAALPIFTQYAQSMAPSGTCLINLGDEGHARGIAFCNVRSMDTLLVPDPYFLSTRGYAEMRCGAAAALPWDQRRPVALWRGAATGYRKTGSILDLPRVKLCAIAAQGENATFVDAGITGLAQVRSEAESGLLNRMGVARDFVPPSQFQNWKYLIDIDGNTNSWPGLFQKLLSGSVVLKIDSGGPYGQWYYERLKPFEHFVPVRNDMADLIEKIRVLRANDALAKAIGAAGRRLAMSMDFESEAALAQQTIETAVLVETHTGGLPVLP
jgi:hypothetical protein